MAKNLILPPLLAAAAVAFLTTPLIIYLYRRLGWLDDPKKTKRLKDTHTVAVPKGGGLAIFLAVLTSALVFLPFDQHLKGILAGATVIAITGAFDDHFDLNPYWRLAIGFLAAGLVVISGIGIAFVTNPFNGIIPLDQPQIHFQLFGQPRSLWVLADLFGLIWIVFMMNIVNWAKGFDGQLPGIVVVAALTIALLALRFSADVTQWPVTILAAITAGAYLGFLPFNFYPQKIMPGYGGGALAGYLLAVLAILSTTKIGTAIVVLGIPFIDAFYSIIRRLAAGQSPVWGDRGHLHHKILDQWHWGKRRTAIFYWLVTAGLGVLALSLHRLQKFYTMIMLAVLIGGLLLWFNFFSSWSGRSDRGKRSKT